MEPLLLYAFIVVSFSPVLHAQAPAQELNPLERAFPCKSAGEQAEAKINSTTIADVYKAVLSDLRSSVDEFIAQAGETEESSLHCLNYYGATLLRLGEYGGAAQVYRRAVKIARATFGADDDSTLTLQGNLAVALLHVGSLDEAAQLQEDTLAHREPLDGTPKQHKLAITLFNLAMIQGARGELAEARALADRGWKIAQVSISTDDPRWSTVLDNYAMVLDQSGSRSQAQEFFEKALSERLKTNDQEDAVESLASLAASYYDMGRVEESDERYREAYGLSKEAFPPLHPTLGEIARSWCRVLSSVGKLKESLARCDEALRIQAAHGEDEKLQMYLTEVNRGVTLGEMERYPEAIESLQSALAGLSGSFPSYALEILEARRSLAVVLIGAGRIPEGSALLADVLQGQTAALGEMHPDVLQTQGNYGVVLAMEGKFKESESILTDYAKKSDVVRALYGRDDRATQGVFSRYASTRMFLAKVLINEGRCREAFDWIEQTKARSLRDQIREHALFGVANEQDRELFSSLNEARNRLYIERSLVAGDGAKETAIDARLRAVDQQIGQLINKARAQEVTVGGEVEASSAVSERVKGSNTIAAAFGLVEQEILIVIYGANSNFQCTSLGAWTGLNGTLWATHVLEANPRGMAGVLAGDDTVPASRIVKTGSRSFELISRAAAIPEGSTIENSADNILGNVGKELFGWLLSKAGASDKLLLSPDGLLGIVAMDALLVNGQPLVSRYTISQVDSFVPETQSTKESVGAQKKSQPIMMVAFGDPVYGAKTPAQTVATAVSKARLVLRGNHDQTVEWPNLPSSGPELRALTDLYHMSPGKTVFARDLATVKNLEALNSDGTLVRTRFLVFSAHAFADVSDPELSSIVLSLPPDGSPRDAYLTAIEVRSLRLNSDLVFFSACETGFGQVVTGEGVLSLSSAALAAGAHATVHTLWSVPDVTSAAFTKRFFSALRARHSPEQALTETKRAFLQDKEHALPAYWAPYVLVQR